MIITSNQFSATVLQDFLNAATTDGDLWLFKGAWDACLINLQVYHYALLFVEEIHAVIFCGWALLNKFSNSSQWLSIWPNIWIQRMVKIRSCHESSRGIRRIRPSQRTESKQLSWGIHFSRLSTEILVESDLIVTIERKRSFLQLYCWTIVAPPPQNTPHETSRSPVLDLDCKQCFCESVSLLSKACSEVRMQWLKVFWYGTVRFLSVHPLLHKSDVGLQKHCMHTSFLGRNQVVLIARLTWIQRLWIIRAKFDLKVQRD